MSIAPQTEKENRQTDRKKMMKGKQKDEQKNSHMKTDKQSYD